MDTFQPHMLDTMFDKLFEEIHKAAGDRLKLPVNLNQNSSQHGSNKHAEKPESDPPYGTEQADISLPKHEGKYSEEGLKKDNMQKRATCSILRSKHNDLVLSSGRSRRFQCKITNDAVLTDLPCSQSSTTEIIDKQQTGMCFEKNKEFATCAEKQVLVSGKNMDKTDAVDERTQLDSNMFNKVIHNHELDVCSDIPVNNSFEHTHDTEYVAYPTAFPVHLVKLSGTGNSDAGGMVSDRYIEHFVSSSEGNTQQICLNNCCDWKRNVNPYMLDISSDVMNMSASSADSSAHIETALDQLFEESLKQGRQSCRMVPPQQWPDSGSNRHRVKMSQQREGLGQMIDLVPSSRRRSSTTERSPRTTSKDLDCQKNKSDMPMYQDIEDCDATGGNVANNKQRQDHILYPEVYHFSTQMQAESTTDLQPSVRRKRVCALEIGSEKNGQISTHTNPTQEILSSNDTHRNQGDGPLGDHCTLIDAKRDGKGDKMEETDVVQNVHTHDDKQGLKEKRKQPLRGAKARKKFEKMDKKFSNKGMIKSKERNTSVILRSFSCHGNLSDDQNKETRELNIPPCNKQKLQHCNEQDLQCGREQFRQQNEEVKSAVEICSSSQKSGQRVNKRNRHLSGYLSDPQDLSLDKPAFDNEKTSSKYSGNLGRECQRAERNNCGLLKSQCDLKKGTKRKRNNSLSNESKGYRNKMSKCKEPRLSKKERKVSKFVFSGSKTKKQQNKINTKNKALKQKGFLQNGHRIIHKIHKTIAESTDVSSNILVSKDRDVNELEAVKISELENIIPLDVLTCKNSRKARLRLEKQKGALHRQVSKDAIWRSVNSKY